MLFRSRSLRRALELGDAWMPFGFKLDELAEVLSDPKTKGALVDHAHQHGTPLKLILAPEPPIDPLGDRASTLSFLQSYVNLGATGFSLRFDHHSKAHYIEQMGAMADLAPELVA